MGATTTLRTVCADGRHGTVVAGRKTFPGYLQAGKLSGKDIPPNTGKGMTADEKGLKKGVIEIVHESCVSNLFVLVSF